jgi:3-oxoacyl-(acyl-carrier-protein) synthase
MQHRRVVITGLGLVTPLGTGPEAFWASLRERRSRVTSITRFDPTPFKSHIAAEVPDFHPTGSPSSPSLPPGSGSTTLRSTSAARTPSESAR